LCEALTLLDSDFRSNG